MVDKILLEYKGSDLQPRGASGPATAAERQEREVVHHAVCVSPAKASSVRQTLELHLNDRWQNTAVCFATNYIELINTTHGILISNPLYFLIRKLQVEKYFM